MSKSSLTWTLLSTWTSLKVSVEWIVTISNAINNFTIIQAFYQKVFLLLETKLVIFIFGEILARFSQFVQNRAIKNWTRTTILNVIILKFDIKEIIFIIMIYIFNGLFFKCWVKPGQFLLQGQLSTSVWWSSSQILQSCPSHVVKHFTSLLFAISIHLYK